jgi:hypothetical protein
LSTSADLGFGAQQRTEVEKPVGKGVGRAAPADLVLHALIGFGGPDRRAEIGFRPVSGFESRLALVVEGPEHEPAIHVAEASDLLSRRVQIAATQACVRPQCAGIGALGGPECRRSFGLRQRFLDVQRIGAVPAAPNSA